DSSFRLPQLRDRTTRSSPWSGDRSSPAAAWSGSYPRSRQEAVPFPSCVRSMLLKNLNRRRSTRCDILHPKGASMQPQRATTRMKASDFPQEVLNLFDLYVHGAIGRREFIEGAKKYAVGGMTAAMIFEALRPNYAWAEQVPKDDSRIKTSRETVQSPQGNGTIKGYLARPASASGKLPGILVVHENRG